MSHAAQETSQSDGQPIFLYTFARGASIIARYTSAQEDFAFTASPSVIYSASQITHSAVRTTSNVDRDELSVTLPRSDTFAQGLREATGTRVTMTLFSLHLNDTAEEAVVVWKGNVANIRQAGQDISFTVQGYGANATRSGAGVPFDRLCPWVLYGDGCGLDIASFQDAGTVSAISGRVLTITEAALESDGWYRGGILQYSGESRYIEEHTGDQITLLESIPDLDAAFAISSSESVTIARGCDLTRSTCETKFNNLDNALMFDFIPTRKPFAGQRP